jgi:hypothetical protein
MLYSVDNVVNLLINDVNGVLLLSEYDCRTQ